MSSIVFTFIRCQPPTTGHERLVSSLVETARHSNSASMVFLSQTHNNTTDPLDWNFKRRVFESAFKGIPVSSNEKIKTPFQALESFVGKYTDVTLVVGGDRLGEFTQRMSPYAAKWGLTFNVVSAGDRLAESVGVEGMSATKMREYARTNNIKDFYQGLPSTLSEGVKKMIFNNTRRGMKK